MVASISHFTLDNSHSELYAKEIDSLLDRGDSLAARVAAVKLQIGCLTDCFQHTVMVLAALPQGVAEGDLSKSIWHTARALAFIGQLFFTPLILAAPQFVKPLRDSLALNQSWEDSFWREKGGLHPLCEKNRELLSYTNRHANTVLALSGALMGTLLISLARNSLPVSAPPTLADRAIDNNLSVVGSKLTKRLIATVLFALSGGCFAKVYIDKKNSSPRSQDEQSTTRGEFDE